MNSLYNVLRVRMLQNTEYDWLTLPVRMLAVISPYTFDEMHTVVGDLAQTSRVESELFTNKAIGSRGFAKSDPAWFKTPPVGLTWQGLVLIEDTPGPPLNRILMAYYDTGINLPRVPNGQDELVIPDWLSQQGWFRA